MNSTLPAILDIETPAGEVVGVNAREVWEALESKDEFQHWFKYQIKSLGLVEDVDYVIIGKNPKRDDLGASEGAKPKFGDSRGANKKDYGLTLDIAKHIALASRTAKGREIRDYFIECEKYKKRSLDNNLTKQYDKLVEYQQTLITQKDELIKQQSQMMERMEAFEEVIEERAELKFFQYEQEAQRKEQDRFASYEPYIHKPTGEPTKRAKRLYDDIVKRCQESERKEGIIKLENNKELGEIYGVSAITAKEWVRDLSHEKVIKVDVCYHGGVHREVSLIDKSLLNIDTMI